MELDRQKVSDIFEKVYQLTFDGKLEWSATDTKHTTFIANVGKYVIYLQGLDSLSYNFIIRRKGENIDLGKITTTFLTSNSNKLEGLFNKVKRMVLKIDEGLDDLLKTLGEI